MRLFDACKTSGDEPGSDIHVSDRTEQATVNAGLLRDRQGKALKTLAKYLRGGELLGLDLFELSATRFELFEGGFGCPAGLLLRDQEIAGVAIANANDFAEIANVNDFFEQNDLHDWPPDQLWLSVKGNSARKRARLMAVSSWRW